LAAVKLICVQKRAFMQDYHWLDTIGIS